MAQCKIGRVSFYELPKMDSALPHKHNSGLFDLPHKREMLSSFKQSTSNSFVVFFIVIFCFSPRWGFRLNFTNFRRKMGTKLISWRKKYETNSWKINRVEAGKYVFTGILRFEETENQLATNSTTTFWNWLWLWDSCHYLFTFGHNFG